MTLNFWPSVMFLNESLPDTADTSEVDAGVYLRRDTVAIKVFPLQGETFVTASLRQMGNGTLMVFDEYQHLLRLWFCRLAVLCRLYRRLHLVMLQLVA
jgi:hypothetical protein